MQIYQSALESRLTENIVLLQNSIDKNKDTLTDTTLQDTFISKMLNAIPNILRIIQSKNESKGEQRCSLYDIIKSVIEKENPARIVIKLNLDPHDCTTLQGIQLITSLK